MQVNPREDAPFFYTGRVWKNGNSKFVSTPLGINEMRGCPRYIAEFLNFENPKKYTGHSFRRTSASIMSDSGMNLLLFYFWLFLLC